uniref:Uncharacterized protein n=1 Tax=Globodera rostochiensis TaxID=31243 RepID=A0A914IDA5_GLORO
MNTNHDKWLHVYSLVYISSPSNKSRSENDGSGRNATQKLSVGKGRGAVEIGENNDQKAVKIRTACCKHCAGALREL